MTRTLLVHRAGPGVTIQDNGRPGFLSYGLSRGGAADRLAVIEGAALLGQSSELALLEMAGFGGEFEVTQDTRIALTGAPMRASIDGARVLWNASHVLKPGQRLSIGAAEAGVYGYLHLGGGVASLSLLGARSAHLAAGIGQALQAGGQVPLGPDPGRDAGKVLDAEARFDGGTIRIVPSLQTAFFEASEIKRFEETTFHRDARGNRMGVRIVPDGDGFQAKGGLSVLSEVIVPGDIQVTGDGSPFVLLTECQTTGGYPRIGSVLPADLPRVAQARAGAALEFRFVTLYEAVEIERRERDRRNGLRAFVRPLIRDPAQIPDLLSYQLISGVVSGEDPERI